MQRYKLKNKQIMWKTKEKVFVNYKLKFKVTLNKYIHYHNIKEFQTCKN